MTNRSAHSHDANPDDLNKLLKLLLHIRGFYFIVFPRIYINYGFYTRVEGRDSNKSAELINQFNI